MDVEKTEVLSTLRQLGEEEFECFVADLWEHQGWNTTVTQMARDYGIDVIAEKERPFPQKYIIQAKKYGKKNKISGPNVQQYSSLRHQENADGVLIVTTSSFTKQAEEAAKSLNVKLIDSDSLFDVIVESESTDLLREHGLLRNQSSSSTSSQSTTSKRSKSSSTSSQSTTSKRSKSSSTSKRSKSWSKSEIAKRQRLKVTYDKLRRKRGDTDNQNEKEKITKEMEELEEKLRKSM